METISLKSVFLCGIVLSVFFSFLAACTPTPAPAEPTPTRIPTNSLVTEPQSPTPTVEPTWTSLPPYPAIPTPANPYPYPAVATISNTPFLATSTPTRTATSLPNTPGPSDTPTNLPICSTSYPFPAEHVITEKSEILGWCKITVPLTGYKTIGYSLIYPEEWTVRLDGPEGMNLFFNEGILSGTNQEALLQLTYTSTPLELNQADQATYGFETFGPEPFVDPAETTLNKEIRNIGDQQVLVLITTLDEKKIQRYFFIRSDENYQTIYMFEVSTPSSEFGNTEHVILLETIEEMITSMQFVR